MAQFDVIIIGGGIGGLVAGALLADAGHMLSDVAALPSALKAAKAKIAPSIQRLIFFIVFILFLL